MPGISLVEWGVIIIIAVIIVDPHDWPVIIRRARGYWQRLMRVYHEIMGQLRLYDD